MAVRGRRRLGFGAIVELVQVAGSGDAGCRQHLGEQRWRSVV